MAIPFASLRFPNQQQQVWRVDFWRNRPREARGQYSWAAYDRDDPCWPCQWGTVIGIADIAPGRGVELLPSVVGHQFGYRSDTGDFESEDIGGEVSLGAKYTVSSSVMAEATYNPDFSQVESDAAQIDINTTFALFYPERRPFFQEGSDLFNTYFNVVYTRSINDPEFAAKLTGRPGRTNIAFLSARDENTPVILPFEEGSAFVAAGRSTSNILRARHALGDQSHLGFVATDRRLDGGGSGTVLGMDGRVRLTQSDQIEWQFLGSNTREPDDPELTADLDGDEFDGGKHTAVFDGESFRGHAIYGSFEHNTRHVSLDLDYWERSPTFRADNGFEPSNNERLGFVNAGYTIFFENSLIEWINPNVQAGREWNFDGVRKDEFARINLSTRLKWAQTSLHTQYLYSNELFQGIQFDDIHGWHLCFNFTPTDLVRGGGSVNFGHRIARRDLVMGKESSFFAWADIKPLDRLLLENSINYIKSNDLRTGARLFAGYIARSRLTLQVTRELATRLVAQYNDFAERWEVDPLITYRLNPFSIFYVGSTRDYRHLTVSEHGIGGWQLTDRQYFMKLQYLFQL